MQNNKRERCINWEKEEKQLFRSVLRPYLSVIENKDLTTNTNKERMKAWNEITEKFNLTNLRTRDKKQLINQWKCLKLNSKKELSSYRRETLKTGGGPKPPSPSPDIMEVAEMIPQEFEVDCNEFDCDGIMDVTSDIIQNIYIPEENKPSNINRNEKGFKIEVPKGEVEPTEQYPITTPKKNKKKAPETNQEHNQNFNFGEASYADMHSFRVLENERLQKEHELRLKNMAEFHSQVMSNLKLQEKILTKTLETYNKNK